MRRETLFVSDLHLGAARPETARRFLNFLDTQAKGAERLYVLGDLFDAYIGDDDGSNPNRDIKAALRRLVDAGTETFFQHGNRDFLLGERFALVDALRECIHALWSGLLVFAIVDGVVFDDVDLDRQIFAVIRQLVRIANAVVEVLEDDVLKCDARSGFFVEVFQRL